MGSWFHLGALKLSSIYCDLMKWRLKYKLPFRLSRLSCIVSLMVPQPHWSLIFWSTFIVPAWLKLPKSPPVPFLRDKACVTEQPARMFPLYLCPSVHPHMLDPVQIFAAMPPIHVVPCRLNFETSPCTNCTMLQRKPTCILVQRNSSYMWTGTGKKSCTCVKFVHFLWIASYLWACQQGTTDSPESRFC